MSFLNPFLLLGIMAVAVPLLIHLINLRRPTKIRFSTLSFFDSLQESAMRRIQIKRWLLLALRMAAILMLAMALARPFIPSGLGLAGAGEQPGRIGILIDNSPGMDQVDRDGPFIDQAKQVALDIISRTRSDDRIGVEVTNGDPLNLPVLNAVSAASRVEELETVNKGNFLAANMESLVNRLETDRPAGRIYFITDGQATQFDDLREAETVFGLEQDLQVILVGEDTQSNTAVTEVRLESELISRDQPAVVSASVRNFGRSPVRNHFLSLDVGDEIAGQHQLSLEAGESAWYDFEVLPGDEGALAGSFLLEGDEMTFDNRRYFSVRIPDARHILVVQDEADRESSFPSYLVPVLDAGRADNGLLEVSRVTWEESLFEGDQPDVIILDGVDRIPDYATDNLIRYVQGGGGVLFLPSANGDMRSYNRFLEHTGLGRFEDVEGSYGSFSVIDRLAPLERGHPVLDEIFDITDGEDPTVNLPGIFYQYRLDLQDGSDGYRLLDTENGNPVLVEQSFGEGRFMVSSIGADAGWSDFPVKPVFAPIFYRTVHYLADSENLRLMEHTLGNRFELQLDGIPEDVSIEIDGRQIYPERGSSFQGLVIRDPARGWSPGFAGVAADGEKINIALNPDTMESDFAALEEREMEELLDDHFLNVSVQKVPDSSPEEFGEEVQAGYSRELWYWFITGALILLLTESVTARLFKAESIQ